jgi:hypothetical protein
MNWQNRALEHQKEAAMTDTTGTNIVELKTGGAVVLDDELSKMGGMGAENVQAKDVLIPRLTILQKLSPQLAKKKAEYIEGADLGDFCNVATGDVYKEAVLVIPCHFATAYIEWGKNRSGLVHNYGDDASILKKCVRDDKNRNVLNNGNVVNETSQWYCLLQDGASWTRVFMPLTSTNLKHSRKWMTLCRTENVQMPNGELWKPPLFWRSWKLSAVEDSNDQGDWVTFKPEKGASTLELDPNRQLIRMCMSFYEDVSTAKVRGEIVDEDQGQGRTINGSATSTEDKDIPF